jgi:hypothetical protein
LVTLLSIAPKLVYAIQSLLESAAKTLADRERRFAKNKSTTETELSAFGRLIDVFVRDLLTHIDKIAKNVFPPSLIANILATNVKELIDGAKENSHKCPVTMDLASILKLLPEKYVPITGIAQFNDNLKLGMNSDCNLQPVGSGNVSQISEAVSLTIQQATPESKLPRLKDIDKPVNQVTTKIEESEPCQSSYVVDRVDIIAKEIEESKISEIDGSN